MSVTKRLLLICAVVMGTTFAVPRASRPAEDGPLKPKSEPAGRMPASSAHRRLPFKDSPFGFHPADVPLDVGSGDRWACAREIGVRWHRPVVYAFWFRCQSDDAGAIFHWDKLDESVRGVPKDTNILWNLSARSRTRPHSFLPRDMKGYKDYVRAVVERYDGDGKDDGPGSPMVCYWQAENEPNLGRQGTPEQYAVLLRETYRVAKQANPRCRIVIGGVGGWVGHGPGSSLHGFRNFYLPALKRLGGTGFDVFDYHWYGNATGDYRAYGAVHREVRAALDRHGFEHVPIWITEMGSFSGKPKGHPPQSERQQAADLVKRYVYPMALGVEKIFWAFGLVEGFKHNDGYFDHTGLIYNGRESSDEGRGVKKLSYHTYRLMTKKLEGKRFAGEVSGLPANVCAYRFGRAPELVTVIWRDWWNDPDAKDTTLSLPIARDVRVTSAITARDGTQKSWQAEAKEAKVVITVGKEPLFVEPAMPGDR